MLNGNPHGLHAARCGSATFGRTLSKKGEAEFGQGGRTIQVSEERERTSLINKMAIASLSDVVLKIFYSGTLLFRYKNIFRQPS